MSRWFIVGLIAVSGICASLMLIEELNKESPLLAIVMVDSECGKYRTSGKMSEFYWAVFGIKNVKAAAKPSPARGELYDYEFIIQYYPASCEHTVFLQDPLGQEKIRTRIIDKKIWIIEDEFSAFNTTYIVANRLIAFWQAGAKMRW